MEWFRKYKTIEEVIPGFLLEKEMVVQNKSFLPYLNHCTQFVEWLKKNDILNQPMYKITSQNITEFFYYIGKDRNLDRPTCEKYYLDLRQLFKFALKIGEIETIPFDNVTLPRKKKDQGADVIQQEHLKPLLLLIKEKDPQLFLACMIQYYCFIRPGKELRLLKVGDVDLHNGIITVRQENAKNKQRQSVTIPAQLIELLTEYGISEADKDLFIFGKKKKFGNKPVSVNMLRWRFNKHRNTLELPTSYKFYSFKHTGASALHMSGISMRELMDHLRHTKLEATQHYVKKHVGIINDRIRDNFPSAI